MESMKMQILLLLQKASEYRTLEELTEFYMINLPYLCDYTIINSTDTDQSIDLYDVFLDITNVKEQIYIPFSEGKINMVSKDIVARGIVTGDGMAFAQRYISFDTQVISYISRYYSKQDKSLPQSIKDVINLLYQKQIGVEYLPYAIENLFFSDRNVAEVKDSIFAFERLYYKKRVPKWFCLYRANRIIRIYERWRKNDQFAWIRIYYLIYAVLLEMCCIQLSSKASSLQYKMKKLCEFMSNELCTMMYPELILAKRYFEKGQQCTFFGKIQKNSGKNISNIKNMAWDLFHLRMLEVGCTIGKNKKADANIPYFCTYDQRLLQIKDCYELKSLAINYNTGEKVSFYSKVDEITEYLKEYSDERLFAYRINQREDVQIKDIIARLEKKIDDIS